MRNFKYILPCLALALLTACATQPLDRQILNADKGVTAVLTATDSALNAHIISVKQAESVSAITHQVNPLLDSARAAVAANDTAAADKTMKLVNALLAGLAAYVPPVQTP